MDTTSLGFQKPKEEEYYDINIFNKNTQLANDLIEKNSSAIGQKLDKDSSFCADLEAYYGNTKLIDDFQDISKWTQWIGIQSADTTNVKIGIQSLKISENDNLEGQTYSVRFNTNVDLSSLNNGEISTDNDYVYLVCYISDIGKINVSEGIQLLLSQAPDATTANCKNMNFTNGLVTGWNFLKAKKSEFTTNGTGKWTDIQSIRIRWYSLANSQNAYVSFQLIQLVKADPDTLLDRPNPFQKFGVRDFVINSGEWFVGREFGKLCIKELKGEGYNVNALSSVKSFSNFIASGMLKAKSNSLFGFCIVYKDSNNNIQIEMSSNLLKVRVYENAILTTYSTPATISTGDTIFYTFEKKGTFLDLKIYKNRKLTPTYMLKGASSLNNLTLSISHGSAYTGDIYSVCITEILHAHHSDIAEVAKNLEYRDLKIPSIDLNSYKIKTFNKVMLNPSGQNEVEIDLGSGYFTGALEITLASGYNVSNASGVIKKIIDFIGVTSIASQNSKYTHIGVNTGKYFMISDIYVKNGKKYIKVVQSSLSRNSAIITLQGYGDFEGLENATIGTPVASTETFVEPSMAPVETIITSGFTSGWSGTLSIKKTQEGLITVNGDLTSTWDITADNLIYTLPVSLRPSRFALELINGKNNLGVAVLNSLYSVVINTDGSLIIRVSSSTTAGVRKAYFQTSYY